MTEPLRVAIIGTGNIARSHAKALAAVGEAGGRAARLVAVMDADEAALNSFRTEFGIRDSYGGLDDLISRTRPDLVHVCTPPSTHAPLALGCLRAGVSVLVEKPPAISLREFDQLATADGGEGGRGSRPFSSTGSGPGSGG